MKKTLLSLALLAASTGALATETYDGRLSGMAGAGYVTGGYSDGVLLNPSLAASYGEKDDFAWVNSIGGIANHDEKYIDDLQDDIDDLVEFTDYLNEANIEDLTEANAEELKRLMTQVDEKELTLIGGGSIVISIPNSFLSLALVSKASIAGSGYIDIDEDDYDFIDEQTGEAFDPDDLQSSVSASGIIVTELGAAFAKDFSSNINYKILVGVTPKKVNVETFAYTATVSEYDEDDFDADDYTVEDDITSMDAGVTVISGGLRYGLSVSNVNGQKFRTVDGGTFELATLSTAAVGWSKDWLTAEASIDLNAVPTLGFGGDTQMFRAGVEVSPLSWLQLRAGIQRDMEDTIPNGYSLGFGLSPFDVVNIDVVSFTGDDDATGAALQIGLRL